MADEKANLKVQTLLESFEPELSQGLADDFLRLPTTSETDPNAEQAEAAPAPPIAGAVGNRVLLNGVEYQPVLHYIPPQTRGRLVIKIVSAKLTKNYGFVRMDPYVRIRVGNVVYETPTNTNGSKLPVWNCTLETYLPLNVESIYVQIFDEKSFTEDECIAWSRIVLPQAIFNNDTVDEWYPLSGRQGEAQEGVVNLIMSFREIDAEALAAAQLQSPDTDPELAAAIEASRNDVGNLEISIPEEQVNEMVAMFPSIDLEVIRTILEDKRGDKQAAATALIELSN